VGRLRSIGVLALAPLAVSLPRGIATVAIPGVEQLEGPAGARPFEGCNVALLDAAQPDSRLVKCKGLTASVSAGTGAAEPLLEAALRGFRAAFAGPVVPREVELNLGGATRPGLRFAAYSKADEAAPTARGVIVALPIEGERLRIISCAASAADAAESACEGMLQALADSLPAPTVAPISAEYGSGGTTLAGRSLSVPAGCSLVTPGRIHCDEAELGWKHVHAGFDLMILIGALRGEYSKIGAVKESVVKCRIEGAESECQVLRVTVTEGYELFTMVGWGAARGQHFFAVCELAGEFKGAAPAPCDQVFATR
jgi:hypothetical protein